MLANGNARMLSRLQREVAQLCQKPPEGIRFVPMEDMNSLVEIHVELDGPGTCGKTIRNSPFRATHILESLRTPSPPPDAALLEPPMT